MKDVIARTRVPYNRKYREKGERFQATNKDAHILVAIGKCEYAPVEPVEPPKPARRRGRPTNSEIAARKAAEAAEKAST